MNHFTTSFEDGIYYINFDENGKSVNTLNKETMKELDVITYNLTSNPPAGLKGVVFQSKKSTFVVGADIAEFVRLFNEPLTEVEKVIKYGQTIFNRIEDLPVATVAIINGSALGGGLELALACDYRVAVDNPSSKIGLPEVKLGLIPAFGGTTRLPRLIGVDSAIELICAGKTLSPKEALKYHVVDLVISQDKAVEAAKTFISFGEFKKKRQPKLDPIKLSWTEWLMAFRLAEGQVSAKAGKNYPAPVKALHVMRDGKKLYRDEALKFEVGGFVEVFSGETAKNLISVFNMEQAIKSSSKKLKSDKKLNIGIIGSGTMGRGIAGYTVGKGLNVKLYDLDLPSLDKCYNEVKKYQMTKVGNGYITVDDAMNVLSRLKPTSRLEDLFDCDLIIEAIYENFDVKAELLHKLKEYKGVIATNTSSISVDKLAKETDASKFCGLHFFNPVNKMPLVEIVKGKETSEETLNIALNYVNLVGKTGIVCKDCNGFVVNRLLFPYLVAFDNLVNSGVSFEKIDKVAENFGWPMGPGVLSDLVGIDVLYHAAKVMKDAYPDRIKFDSENGATAKLVKNKNFGQKSGKGWYNWSKKDDNFKKGSINFEYTAKRELSDEDIMKELIKPMQREAKFILDEGVVSSWNEINAGLIFGAGFPAFKGGLNKI